MLGGMVGGTKEGVIGAVTGAIGGAVLKSKMASCNIEQCPAGNFEVGWANSFAW